MTIPDALPAPLIEAAADLRDFQFLPIDVVRLFGSSFHARATDSEWRAGVTLWLKSWHQVPAGSLPADDVSLCRLAELGRDLDEWAKVKAGALHGWIACADGRLYHPTVVEKAVEAWRRKTDRTREREADADRKRREREDRARLFDELRAVGIVPKWNATTAELRALVGGPGRATAPAEPQKTPQPSDSELVTRDRSRTSDRTSDKCHGHVTARTGTGTGTGTGTEDQRQKQTHVASAPRLIGDRPGRKVRTATPAATDDPPEGVRPETWAAYLRHRQEKRARMTPTAEQGLRAALRKMRAAGEDVDEAVAHSTACGYTGVFPSRGSTRKTSRQATAAAIFAPFMNTDEGASHDHENNPADTGNAIPGQFERVAG